VKGLLPPHVRFRAAAYANFRASAAMLLRLVQPPVSADAIPSAPMRPIHMSTIRAGSKLPIDFGPKLANHHHHRYCEGTAHGLDVQVWPLRVVHAVVFRNGPLAERCLRDLRVPAVL